MGLLVAVGPRSSRPRPQWHRTPHSYGRSRGAHTAHCACCRSSPSRLHCMVHLYPCIPLGPPSPPFSVLSQATTSPSWFFCPARTEPAVPPPIPNPAALHLKRHPILQNLSRERGGSKPFAAALCTLHSAFASLLSHTNKHYGPPHYLPTHPCSPPFDTVACRSLASFPPFASSFFSDLFQSHPPAITNKQWTGWRRDRTSLPKHRMSGSHNTTRYYYHPPLCQS